MKDTHILYINIKKIFKIGLQALGEFWSFRKKMKKEANGNRKQRKVVK